MTIEAAGALVDEQMRDLGEKLELIDRALERGGDAAALKAERKKLERRLESMWADVTNR